MSRWVILCPDCSPGEDDEDITTFNAEDGYQGEGDEGCILVCAEWDDDKYNGTTVDKYFCDECGCPIAVPMSARWFINNHREERERELEER